MKILIADDDRLTASLLGSYLTNSGYDVTVVSDGASALRALTNPERPQLAILDWMMPIMNGPDICREVRRAEGPYVYLLLLTGHCDPNAITAGIAAGADDCMSKPFHPAELQAQLLSVKRIVEQQQLQRADSPTS